MSPKSDKEKLEERLHQHRKIKGEQVRSLVIDEAVEELVTDMEEHVGDSLVEVMGCGLADSREVGAPIVMDTGIVSLDGLLGGIYPGVTELYAPAGVGKTTLLGHIVAHAQQLGKDVAWVPTEDTDFDYLGQLDVDLDKLVLIRIADMHDSYLLKDFVLSEPNRVLAIDSVTALRSPQKGESLQEAHSRWLSKVWEFMDEVNDIIHPSSCVFFTSQVRARKSVHPMKQFAGGWGSASQEVAQMFATRLELRREEVTDDTYTMSVNVIANTLKPPATYVKLPVVKGLGVDIELDLVRVAVECGVINKAGSWYSVDEQQLGQGEQAAAAFLVAHPSVRGWVHHHVKEALGA